MTMDIHGRQIGWTVALVACVALFIGGEAHALTLDGSGAVTDWGFTPFSAWTPTLAPGDPAVRWKEENDWSPISYPGIGHVPSPGNAGAEAFDAEALYCRVNGSDLQVLVVSSTGHQTEGPGVAYFNGGQYWYRMGDLFLNTDAGADGTWDFAMSATDYNEGHRPGNPAKKMQWWAYDAADSKYVVFGHDHAPGTLYDISYDGTAIDPDDPDTQVVSIVNGRESGGEWTDGTNLNHRGYGNYAAYEPQLRPWVVMSHDADGNERDAVTVVALGGSSGGPSLVWDWFDYGGKENNTWFYEYSMPLSLLGLDGTYDVANLGIHITTECGNDKLTLDGIPPPPPPPIPEPATMAGLVLGVGSLVGYLRHRR
jgi:hypothetical protein